jgi:hypothetical protein
VAVEDWWHGLSGEPFVSPGDHGHEQVNQFSALVGQNALVSRSSVDKSIPSTLTGTLMHIRALPLTGESLIEYDYTVAFDAPLVAGDSRSPEQLARATFEGAPRPMRWFLVVGWRFALGLRLGPRSSPEYVLGWTIVARESDSVTLGLASWLFTARLVIRIAQSRVTHSTYVSYDRRIAAVIWPPVSVLHCQIVPRLLRRATRHSGEVSSSR